MLESILESQFKTLLLLFQSSFLVVCLGISPLRDSHGVPGFAWLCPGYSTAQSEHQQMEELAHSLSLPFKK